MEHYHEDDLLEYLGTPADAHSREMDGHLADCPVCRGNLFDVAKFRARFSEAGRMEVAKTPERSLTREASMQTFNPFSSEVMRVNLLQFTATEVVIEAEDSLSSGASIWVKSGDWCFIGQVTNCVRGGRLFRISALAA